MQHEVHEAFVAFIGLDWADATHDVCLPAAGSEHREHCSLAHTPEAIDAWVGSLHKRCEGKPIALGLELNKGPIVFALRTSPCFVLLPVNPLTRARYRAAFPPSRAKDDPTATRCSLSHRRAPPCAPWHHSSHPVGVSSVTQGGSPLASRGP